jgi:protoporphyrinogen/coproporphyrinogen III oxidase
VALKKRVAIVGGGITGLSVAYYLQQQVATGDDSIEYTLLEQADQWGGKVQTEQIDHAGGMFVVESGPDSFITQKPWGWELAQELDLGHRVQPTNDKRRQTFVLNRGKVTPLPEGVMLIVPTQLKPFALSPLISPLGKLRMGMDLFIRPRLDDEDETLAEFIRRRLGSEALDKIAEPLLSGIYNAQAESQSILATFPRFRDIESKHGSLIRGMLAARQPHANGRGNGVGSVSGTPKPPSAFVSFRQGMSELIQRLRDELTGDCRLATCVNSLEQRRAGYSLHLDDGDELATDFVVLAIPSYEAARLLDPMAPAPATLLRAVRYVSTGTVSLAYRREEVNHPLNGFGIVIPRSEQRDINAITWTSTKFDNRAPAGHALLRVFFGGSRTPHMMEVDDASLLATVRRELAEIMGITAAPVFHRVYRWWDATPQYDVGHLDRVAAIESLLPPRLHVTGSPYRGIGLPDCIHQARQTVERIIEHQPALRRTPDL